MNNKEINLLRSYATPHIINRVRDKSKVFKLNNIRLSTVLVYLVLLTFLISYSLNIFNMFGAKITTHRIAANNLLTILALLLGFAYFYKTYIKSSCTIRFDDEHILIEQFGHIKYSFNISGKPRIRIDAENLNISKETVPYKLFLSIQQEDKYFKIPYQNFSQQSFNEFMDNFDLQLLEKSPEEIRLASSTDAELTYEKNFKNKEFEITSVKDFTNKTVFFRKPIMFQIFMLLTICITYFDIINIAEIVKGNLAPLGIAIMTLAAQAICFVFTKYFKRRCMYTLDLRNNYFKINGHRYDLNKEKVSLYVAKGLREAPGKNIYYLLDTKNRFFYTPILRIPENRLNCLDPIFVSLGYDTIEKRSK